MIGTATGGNTKPDPFTEIRMLALYPVRGANYWSRRPVTRLDVDIGAYEDISSADVPGFTEQLVAAIPSLETHRCSVGTHGGFIERLRDGTYTAHIAEHVALALQSLIGHDVGYGRTRGTGDVGRYTVAFEHIHEGVGLRAAALALETVQLAFAGTLDGVTHAIAELQAIAETPAAGLAEQHVLCGITGSTGRAATRHALTEFYIDNLVSNSHLIIDLSPAYLLQAGLPYSHSDVAVILDATLTDVPERYRDAERAAKLVSIVADAVPHEQGVVVCPADAHQVHELVRKAGRRVAMFTPSNDVQTHAHRAATAVMSALRSRTEHDAT